MGQEKGSTGFLSILNVCVPFEGQDPSGKWTDFFWLSASVRCLVGVRAGFNIAEFADFLLGWFGLDIADDDGRASETAEEKNKGRGSPR